MPDLLIHEFSGDRFFSKKFFFYIGVDDVALVAKNPPAKAGDERDTGSVPGSRRSPGTPVFLPGKFQGQRSLAGWGHKELDTTAHTHTHTHTHTHNN